MIELCQVSKTYQKGGQTLHALHEVSLQVDAGDFLAVVGPSGSGKTTLMNIIGCLDTPSAGQYRLQGQTIARLRGRQMARVRGQLIGFIFQSFNLIPGMSALENVELPLVLRGQDRKSRRARAMQALEQVGLSARQRHRPWELSGGQQQRVAIARVLAADPGLILADEPTGNLDARSGGEVMDIITGLHQAGKTIVLITHDANIAARAPHMLRMHDGQIQKER